MITISILIVITGICYCYTYFDKDTDVVINLSDESDPSKDVADVDHTESSSETTVLGEVSNETMEDDVTIYVHICGAIVNPGVYEVSEDTRIVDLIEVAGGLEQEAAGDYINQAQQVEDGQQIYIPTEDEVSDVGLLEFKMEDLETENDEGVLSPIDINKADVSDFMKLPGIGQAKAESIIKYRNSYGDFQSTEDLMKIAGIKEGVFQKISSYVFVK